MNWFVRLVCLNGLLAAAGGCAPAASQPPQETTILRDVDGLEHRLFEAPSPQPVVLVFFSQDCPIANAYAPEIGRLYQEFQPRGVRWLVVHSDPQVTPEAARRHAKEYELPCPVLLDPQQRLAREAGATRTPEAAVYSSQRELLYLGRIDDRYVGLGKRRPQPTTHDLRDALEAILAGRPVETPRTEAIGCDLPPL
jgi:peroxiredoxin